MKRRVPTLLAASALALGAVQATAPAASAQAAPGETSHAGAHGPTGRAPRRGIPAWAAGLAAAVALLAGLGIGRMTGGESEAPEAVDPGTVVAAADLTALDSDDSRGVARAVRTDESLTLRVSASELGDEAGVREVWLINVDGKRMVAVGLIASGDEGSSRSRWV